MHDTGWRKLLRRPWGGPARPSRTSSSRRSGYSQIGASGSYRLWLLVQRNQTLPGGAPASQIIHIHGKLGDDPTLGIDNENQWKAAYPLSRNGKRAFVKPFFNEEYDRMRVVEAVNIINSADTICTYGLTLGESDLTWRNVLIDWLQRNTKNHLFVYRYGISHKSYLLGNVEKCILCDRIVC